MKHLTQLSLQRETRRVKQWDFICCSGYGNDHKYAWYHMGGNGIVLNKYILRLTLGPSDAIWRCRSGSTMAQVMACCLTAPSHYLNQCWLIINKVHWHSYKDNLTLDALAINHFYYLENHLSKFSFKSPGGQWIKHDFSDTWTPSQMSTHTYTDEKCPKNLCVIQIAHGIQGHKIHNTAHMLINLHLLHHDEYRVIIAIQLKRVWRPPGWLPTCHWVH